MYKQKVNVHKLDLRRMPQFSGRDAPIFHIKRPFCEKYKKNVFYYFIMGQTYGMNYQ